MTRPSAVRSSARSSPRRATAYGRAAVGARGPRRLLRALRRGSGAGGAARRQPACSSGRCSRTSCAARSNCPPSAPASHVEARARRCAARRYDGRARGAPAAVDRAARALATPGRQPPAPAPPTSAPAACAGRSARLAETAYGRLDRRAADDRATNPPAPGRRRRGRRRPCAGASPLAELEADRDDRAATYSRC